MEKIKIKNEHFFKNKWQMLIYIIVFAILIWLFILVGTKEYDLDIPDNERFSQEYSLVNKENVFKYVNVQDAYMVANGKKGIVFMGNPMSKWANYYANIVNDVAKELGIQSIYYYNFFDDRTENNGTYESMVNILKDYVTYDDLGNAEIYSPSLLVVSGGKIIYFDSETSFIKGQVEPNQYWTNYQRNLKINELKTVFQDYLEG